MRQQTGTRPPCPGEVWELQGLVEVAPVGTADARRALSLPMAKVEDAFQAAAALAWEADCIVTRNTSDYRHSPVPALSPAAFLRRTNRPRSGER